MAKQWKILDPYDGPRIGDGAKGTHRMNYFRNISQRERNILTGSGRSRVQKDWILLIAVCNIVLLILQCFGPVSNANTTINIFTYALLYFISYIRHSCHGCLGFMSFVAVMSLAFAALMFVPLHFIRHDGRDDDCSILISFGFYKYNSGRKTRDFCNDESFLLMCCVSALLYCAIAIGWFRIEALQYQERITEIIHERETKEFLPRLLKFLALREDKLRLRISGAYVQNDNAAVVDLVNSTILADMIHQWDLTYHSKTTDSELPDV